MFRAKRRIPLNDYRNYATNRKHCVNDLRVYGIRPVSNYLHEKKKKHFLSNKNIKTIVRLMRFRRNSVWRLDRRTSEPLGYEIQIY